MIQTVDKKSSVPAYQQLRKLLLEQIKNNVIRPGERILSENQLCKTYNVSRTTVRQAINSLTNDGLLFSAPGKGTFLNGITQEATLEYIESFQSEARRRGFTADVKVLDEGVQEADQMIARHLSIKEGEPVIRIKRVKIANNVPLFTETRFIPHKYCPDLVEAHLSGESLTELARSRYHLNVQLRDITVMPVLIKGESAMLLKVAEQTPGLSVTETLLLEDGVPFKWEQRVHKAGLHFTNRTVLS